MINELYVIHITLSVLIFFIINWIGKHSVSLGYITLTAFVRSDDAPAFNVIFRILSPTILIILFASLFYSLGYDRYVENIWLVTIYYCCMRFLFIVTFERVHLVNWIKEIFTWSLSALTSWLVYYYFIRSRVNLLPQPEDLKNEFWILVILFIYSILNNIEFSFDGTVQRKKNYCIKSYNRNKQLYGHIISEQSVDALSESLIYSILLYESFNRPTLVRPVEHLTFPFVAKSIGPMQVKTVKRLTDIESVRLGASIVVKAYLNAVEYGKEKSKEKDAEFNPYLDYNHMKYIQYKVAADYNRDDDYVHGVAEMHDQLIDYVYTSFKRKEPTISFADFYIS